MEKTTENLETQMNKKQIFRGETIVMNKNGPIIYWHSVSGNDYETSEKLQKEEINDIIKKKVEELKSNVKILILLPWDSKEEAFVLEETTKSIELNNSTLKSYVLKHCYPKTWISNEKIDIISYIYQTCTMDYQEKILTCKEKIGEINAENQDESKKENISSNFENFINAEKRLNDKFAKMREFSKKIKSGELIVLSSGDTNQLHAMSDEDFNLSIYDLTYTVLQKTNPLSLPRLNKLFNIAEDEENIQPKEH